MPAYIQRKHPASLLSLTDTKSQANPHPALLTYAYILAPYMILEVQSPKLLQLEMLKQMSLT